MDARSKNFDQDAHSVPYGELLASEAPPAISYPLHFKRGVDVLLVLLSLPLIVPLIALFALLVTVDGGAPFFSQPRVGRGGSAFRMIKLRTMRANAEQHLSEILMSCPASADEWRRTQKLRRDPRITSVGRWLRKTSLDELPQLWNVLTGDMSLVGPRPMLQSQSVLYPGTAHLRMRPGLTGPWQVFARNETGFAARAKYDSLYEQRVGFGYDVSLIARTLGVVVRGTGH